MNKCPKCGAREMKGPVYRPRRYLRTDGENILECLEYRCVVCGYVERAAAATVRAPAALVQEAKHE